MLREFGDGLGVEGVEDPAQVEAEHAEAVVVQPVFQYAKYTAGSPIAVEQQNRIF
jgi:hypothetical protein